MYKHVAGVTMITLMLSFQPVAAQDTKSGADPATAKGEVSVKRADGTIVAAGKVVARGTITNVNAERREITVKRANGKDVVIPTGPEVKNFDQIKVGDQIVVRESESLILSLKKAEGGTKTRERSVSENLTVAKPGEKPSISATRETFIIADVTAVSEKDGTITLKGANQTRKFRLGDPSILSGVKTGDQVEAVVMEGGAISVEPAGSR